MDIFQKLVIGPFERFLERALHFLPNFITAILVLIVGIVFGMVLKVLFLRFFKVIGLDKVSERSGVIELLKKGGIRDSVSVLLSRIPEWRTIIILSVCSIKALEASTV